MVFVDTKPSCLMVFVDTSIPPALTFPPFLMVFLNTTVTT